MLLLFLTIPANAEEIRSRPLDGLEARAAALILSGEEGGNLDVDALVLASEENDDGTVRLDFVLDIHRLHAFDGPRLIEIYAYALDGDNAVGGFLSQGFVVEQGSDQTVPVKFLGHVDLRHTDTGPGEYTLRLLVRERPGDRMALRSLDVSLPWTGDVAPPMVAGGREFFLVVRQEGTAARFPVVEDGTELWPAARPVEIAEDVPEAAPQIHVAADVSEAAKRPKVALAFYADALRSLAEGDVAGAEAQVDALEEVLLLNHPRPSKQPYLATVLSVSQTLVQRKPQCVAPILAFYEKRYREHHANGRFQQATAARRIIDETARMLRAPARSQGIEPWSAYALSSIGGYLLEERAVLAAAGAFHEALQHDPDYVPALLPLATIHESVGEYREATRLFERYVERRPEDAEGRLRLAVNLARLNESERAAVLLQGLTHEPASSGQRWVQVVAFQELARLRLAAHRAGDAVAVLEKAIERFPRNQRLYIQLAATLDEAGSFLRSRRESQAALDRLDPNAERDGPTPRLRYSQWWAGMASDARQDLEEAAEKTRPLFKMVIESMTVRLQEGKKP